MLDFAQQEIVLPDGPYAGLLFDARRQPWSRLLLDEMCSGRWSRFATVGCVQSGKTLLAFVIPTLWHTLELLDTIVDGVPSMDLSRDKWEQDLLPVIRASRYRGLLPKEGAGSRGGRFESITFANGATLKFMSGGGGDEKRSGFTARAAIVTEVDKLDERGGTSRETDKVAQIAARTLSFDDQARVYLECTVSVEEGRIWREYTAGSASRLYGRCPDCGQWVSPEREHLSGWQEAKTAEEARRNAEWICPSCSVLWSDEIRRRIIAEPRLVHRGQTLDEHGGVQGDPPDTRTLGFRWNAFWNAFWSTGTIAAKEWSAARAPDEEAAEKELLQFFWARPWQPSDVALVRLDADKVRRRMGSWRRGIVPAAARYVTIGIDIGKWTAWWMAVAWLEETAHILEYGALTVPSQEHDVELAILMCLRTFRDEMVLEGWPTEDGQVRVPDQVAVDSRYYGGVVRAFCRESGERFRPCEGLGIGQHYKRRYTAPKKKGRQVRLVGNNFHFVRDPEGVFVIEVNADYWKSWLQERLLTPLGQPGAMSIFHSPDDREHIQLSKHLTAERPIEEFIAGVGTVVRWERVNRRNHLLDCGYNACWAAGFCGFRLARPTGKPDRKPPAASRGDPLPLTTPDGRPFLATERSS
jgi:phage terminase large subunit GpA-like protein